MASNRVINLFFLISQIFFLLLSSPYLSSSASRASSSSSFDSSSSSSSSSSKNNNNKVTLSLYYETLCPYCSRFMVNYLPKIFEKGLINIIDLNLVPYGNAKIGSNNTITCQHGPYECLLNAVETCSIHVWPDLNKHFTFIYCIESLVWERKYTEWESCFGKLGLDSKPIADCYKNGDAQKLELQYAAETNALQPPHKFVPWVVVDGQPLYDDYENFITYICKAYKGTAVPKGCRELPIEIVRKPTANHIDHVCYVEDTASTNIVSPVTKWRRQMKMASV